MNDEPRWRKVLCWGAVLMFFSLPAIVFLLHFTAVEMGWQFDNRIEEFRGITPVYETVTALVFGLAGLNSFDRFFNDRKNHKTEKIK